MKAVDILSPQGSVGESTSNSPLDSILNIGRAKKGPANHSVVPALAAGSGSKMTHIDEQHCPKCHQPMEPAFIGQEQVFFCTKHAVTLPRAE